MGALGALWQIDEDQIEGWASGSIFSRVALKKNPFKITHVSIILGRSPIFEDSEKMH